MKCLFFALHKNPKPQSQTVPSTEQIQNKVSMPQRDCSRRQPGCSPCSPRRCSCRASINARFCMAANTRLKSKQIMVQTTPPSSSPHQSATHLKNPCLAALVRASPRSSEPAEGKILVLSLSCAATHRAVRSVCKQGTTKNSILITHREGGRISQSKLAGAIWSL